MLPLASTSPDLPLTALGPLLERRSREGAEAKAAMPPRAPALARVPAEATPTATGSGGYQGIPALGDDAEGGRRSRQRAGLGQKSCASVKHITAVPLCGQDGRWMAMKGMKRGSGEDPGWGECSPIMVQTAAVATTVAETLRMEAGRQMIFQLVKSDHVWSKLSSAWQAVSIRIYIYICYLSRRKRLSYSSTVPCRSPGFHTPPGQAGACLGSLA